jgi:hypothetical protein
MMRGINRQFIFRYDRAKSLFLQLLTEQQSDGAFALVAWCIDDAYLLGTLRYIHLNPVKAMLAPSTDSYAWSSYTEYIDTPRLVDKAQKEFILSIIGGAARKDTSHCTSSRTTVITWR